MAVSLAGDRGNYYTGRTLSPDGGDAMQSSEHESELSTSGSRGTLPTHTSSFASASAADAKVSPL